MTGKWFLWRQSSQNCSLPIYPRREMACHAFKLRILVSRSEERSGTITLRATAIEHCSRLLKGRDIILHSLPQLQANVNIYPTGNDSIIHKFVYQMSAVSTTLSLPKFQ